MLLKGDIFLEAVAENRPFLKSIDLSNTKEYVPGSFTDVGLAALVGGCTLLVPSSYRFSYQYSVQVDKWFSALIKLQADTTAMKFATHSFQPNKFIWQFTPASLSALVRGCPHIPIDSFVHGGDDDFCLAVSERPESSFLTRIDLTHHHGVTDEGLVYLIQACNKLHPDNIIVGNKEVKNDRFFIKVAKRRMDLEKVDLLDTGITEKALIALIIGCPKLKQLNHRAGGDAYCRALLQHRPDLTTIKIDLCEQITTEGLVMLMNGFDVPLDQIEAATIIKNDAFCAAVAAKYPELKQICFKADDSVLISDNTPETKREKVRNLEQSLRDRGFQVLCLGQTKL